MSTDSVAANVRLLCVDADGVLTDGGILIDDLGTETKRFHVRDGTAIRIWLALGNQFAVISGRSGTALAHRMAELGVTHVLQGVSDKAAAFGALLQSLGLNASESAMLADDLPDLPIMKLAGYPMAVGDASREVRDSAEFVTVRPGGLGAVREAIEHLLKERDAWDEAISLFG